MPRPARRRPTSRALVAAAPVLIALLVLSAGSIPARADGHLAGATVQPFDCSGRFTIDPSATPANGSAPLTVRFSLGGAGGCPPYGAEWSFGDGGEAEGANVSHTFRSAGTFDAYVEASDANGSEREARTYVNVTGGAGPLALHVAVAPASGSSPLAVTAWGNVTGGSGPGPGPVDWTFGDGGNGSGSPIHHVFATAGTFLITGTVVSGSAEANASAPVTVTAGSGGGPVNLSIAVAPGQARAPANVTISTYSAPPGRPENLTLCFGDTSPCLHQAVAWNGTAAVAFVHRYLTPGNYSVQGWLTGANASVIAGATAGVAIVAGPPLVLVANLTLSGTVAPVVAGFRALVTGGTAPYSLQWTYGDGSVGASLPGSLVNHTYRAGGSYRPIVTVTDSAGESANATLPTVLVHAQAASGWLPGGSVVPSVVAGGVILALAGSFGGVWFGRRSLRPAREQQLRKEGEEIVRELEEGP